MEDEEDADDISTLMTAPIWSEDTENLVGLIQVANKRAPKFATKSTVVVKEDDGSEDFNHEDIKMLADLATLLAQLFHRLLYDLLRIKASLPSHMRRGGRDKTSRIEGIEAVQQPLLEEYYKEEAHSSSRRKTVVAPGALGLAAATALNRRRLLAWVQVMMVTPPGVRDLETRICSSRLKLRQTSRTRKPTCRTGI